MLDWLVNEVNLRRVTLYYCIFEELHFRLVDCVLADNRFLSLVERALELFEELRDFYTGVGRLLRWFLLEMAW